MARQRRGGFKPPELRGTLGTLLRSAAEQAGVVRDALERGLGEGKARLDDVRANRRRQDALVELGEIVLDLIRRGEIDPTELPEVHEVLHTLDDLDGEGDSHPHDHHHDHDDERVAIPPSRSRFDDRGPSRTERARNPANVTIPGSMRRRPADDGTVSSSVGSGRHASPTRMDPSASQQRIWRPSPVDMPARDAPPDSTTVAPPFRKPGSGPLTRKPGISFEDDDDLAEYMHPDDVPPKPTDP